MPAQDFFRLAEAVRVLASVTCCWFLGRAAEHLIVKAWSSGDVVLMNYPHHHEGASLAGGKVVEVFGDEALGTDSTFKQSNLTWSFDLAVRVRDGRSPLCAEATTI